MVILFLHFTAHVVVVAANKNMASSYHQYLKHQSIQSLEPPLPSGTVRTALRLNLSPHMDLYVSEDMEMKIRNHHR